MSTTTAPAVTVYTTTTCPWCDRVKEYFDKNNVPFVNKDVASDYDAAMEMIRKSGQQGVPVTTVDDEVIVGFDQQRLAKIVQKYAKAKRPPLGLLGAEAEDYLRNHPETANGTPEGTKGIYVGKVRPGSVAERAGLQPGDILQAAAGKRIRSLGSLDQLIDTLNAGDMITIRYLRNGEERQGALQF